MSVMGQRPKQPTYNDAIEYLNSLQTPFKTLEERRKNPPVDLKKSDALQEMLQWTQDIGYQPTDFDRLNLVHVAGTKGKGTTCAFVNSILSQYHHRYQLPKKVGLYTSPHLLSVCERIRINSKPLSEEKFARYFFEVWDRLEDAATKRGADTRVKPAYFRFLTLLSFHVFMEEGVDVAIYEVGVGGEFDSTNIIAKPAVTGITSLGIDHVQVLGATIEEIAWHKAGIMKAGSPAYTVWQPENAMRILEQRAEEKGVNLTNVSIAPCLSEVPIAPDEDFQKRNASLAIALTANVLARFDLSHVDSDFEQSKSQFSETADGNHPLPEPFKAGLTSIIWRGRGETLGKGYGRWFLDGAHTRESLAIVSDWFGRTVQRLTSQQSEKPVYVVLFNQQSSTRAARTLLETIQNTLQHDWDIVPHEAIFCTNVTYQTQAYKPDFVDANSDPAAVKSLAKQNDYATFWKSGNPHASTHVVPSIEEAVTVVRQISDTNPGRPMYILATGSFRLVGGLLTILEGEGIGQEASTSNFAPSNEGERE